MIARVSTDLARLRAPRAQPSSKPLNRFFDNLPHRVRNGPRDLARRAAAHSRGPVLYLRERLRPRNPNPEVLGLMKRLLQHAPHEGR
jgi:hypothetical protein